MKTYHVDKSRLDELKKHGYEELINCFYKELPRNYILRADTKALRIISFSTSSNDSVSSTTSVS